MQCLCGSISVNDALPWPGPLGWGYGVVDCSCQIVQLIQAGCAGASPNAIYNLGLIATLDCAIDFFDAVLDIYGGNIANIGADMMFSVFDSILAWWGDHIYQDVVPGAYHWVKRVNEVTTRANAKIHFSNYIS